MILQVANLANEFGMGWHDEASLYQKFFSNILGEMVNSLFEICVD